MSSLAIGPADILRFALQAERAEETILVTLVGIDGSSPRALGAQMMVTGDGHFCGSFSGGCVEAAIVGEALSVLESNRSRIVRFGAGSPYVDIRLPCGGGIDLLFTPQPDPSLLAALLTSLDARRPAAMAIAPDGLSLADPAEMGPQWRGDAFHIAYLPCLRIIAMGHGDALTATARLAHFFGARTAAFSPSADDVAILAGSGVEALLLTTRSAVPDLAVDPWTAFAFLFHDHDWEELLLPWALTRPHLFVGAIGGERSRRNRLEMLRAQGLDDATLKRLTSPAGLIPATRDPATLALSIVAEIVSKYQDILSRTALTAPERQPMKSLL